MAIQVSRKQRLKKLESEIQDNYEGFILTGNALKEIKDDDLWCEHKDAEGKNLYAGWSDYLGRRVGQEFKVEKTHAKNLMMCASIRPALPKSPRGEWGLREVLEFAPLAPPDPDHSARYDFRALEREVCKEVVDAAVELAEENGKPFNSTHIKAIVATYVPKKKGKKSTKKIDLAEYLTNMAEHAETVLKNIDGLTVDSWKLLEESSPGLVARAATACEELAGFLRSN